MTLEQAQAIVEAVKAASKKFEPIGDPVLTSRGARVEFAEIPVDPRRVTNWFENQYGVVFMVGRECRNGGAVMVAEYRQMTGQEREQHDSKR